MPEDLRIDAALTAFSTCADRFVREGYRPSESLEAMVERAGRIRGLKAIAMDYPTTFADPDVALATLGGAGLGVGMVEVDLYSSPQWKLGSFTAPDEATRKEALRLAKEAMDFCAATNGADVQLWLGQDGYDYGFQVDYAASWERLLEAIREVAEYRSDVKVTVEYKIKEPRNKCHISTVGRVWAIIETLGLPNVGATLDVGHSLMAQENPAEAAAILGRLGRLYHLHLNDCYRDWDHDMAPGSVNFWETIELFYWLEEVGFEGWWGIDIYPYREDGATALQLAVDSIYWFRELAWRVREAGIGEYLVAHDALGAQQLLRQVICK